MKAYRRHTLTSLNKIPSANALPEKLSEMDSIEQDYSDEDEEEDDDEELEDGSLDEEKRERRERREKRRKKKEEKEKREQEKKLEEAKNEPLEKPPIHPIHTSGIRYEYSIEAYQETWKNWRNTPEMVKKFLQQQDEEIMRLRVSGSFQY